MKKGLIGYTGFVGSNLMSQCDFNFLFNSANFQEMANQTFDLLVCTGLPAAKWVVNKNPKSDRDNIAALENVLLSVKAKKFILISTIDVYPVITDADEQFNCHLIENHPYGAHRLAFEEFIQGTFEEAIIIRLPALFGPGIKKNILFDLLNDNCLHAINAFSEFQWYDLGNLWGDIQIVLDHKLKKVNFFTQPISTKEILESYFPEKKTGSDPAKMIAYNLKTVHDNIFGGDLGYIMLKAKVLKSMEKFIKSYRR